MICSQKECREIASWTYVWPGAAKRSWACFTHLHKASAVANAGGFTLGDLRFCTLAELCRDDEKEEGSP
jgi:hypothetical protein